MTLPLQDKNNPLFGLTIQEQCLNLINWQKHNIKPWELFSLNANYTLSEIKKPYFNLAKRFHPDRNNDENADAAFKIIAAAHAYLEYRIKSPAEKTSGKNSMEENPFYKAFEPEEIHTPLPKQTDNKYNPDAETNGFWSGLFGTNGFSFHNIWPNDFGSQFFWNTTEQAKEPPKKSNDEHNFLELIKKAQQNPIPQEVVNKLKQFVSLDKSWLTYSFDKTLPNKNILHIAAQYGDLSFFKWLVDQGADPFLMNDQKLNAFFYRIKEECCDPAFYAAAHGKIDILQFLVQRYGTRPFYDVLFCDSKLIPQWWRLEKAIAHNQAKIARFFLVDAGYDKHLSTKKFDRQWDDLLRSKGDKSATTALILEFNLLSDPKSMLNLALKYGEFKLAQKILHKYPEMNINAYELFYTYIYSTGKANKEAIHWMSDLLDSYPISESQLNSLLYHLDNLLHYPKNYASINDGLVSDAILHQQAIAIATVLIPKASKMFQESPLSPNDKEREIQILTKQSLFATLFNTAIHCASAEIIKGLLTLPKDSLSKCWPNTLINALYSKRNGLVSQTTNQTISLLIDTCGSKLSEATEDSDLYLSNPNDQYTKYTPLHLACILNLKEEALHIIKKMSDEHLSFNSICIKKTRYKNQDLFSEHTFTDLCLAISYKREDIALKLLEAGANLNLKAISLYPPSTLFSEKRKMEQTPLELAIEHKQTKVIQAIQLIMLDDYIEQRKKEEEYLSKISIFGHTLLRFGLYSKTTKLKEALAFREKLINGAMNNHELEKINQGALSQGRLGQITELSKYVIKSHDISEVVRERQGLR